MTPEDIEGLYELVHRGRHGTEPLYFERALAEQVENKRIVFVASGERITGYVHYNRFPKYAPFQKFGIPEAQDLYVDPDCRRQGVGAALLARCEAQALEDQCQEMGIGVGIVSSFGNAQRLYIKNGYIPDGTGVTFDRDPVQTGEVRPLDDRLCLMMIKSLT